MGSFIVTDKVNRAGEEETFPQLSSSLCSLKVLRDLFNMDSVIVL